IGQDASAPSSCCALSAQYGSRSNSRARSTRSASPPVTISLACLASVINPTAPVISPASSRIFRASGTWYPLPTGMRAFGTSPPEEPAAVAAPHPLGRARARARPPAPPPPSRPGGGGAGDDPGKAGGDQLATPPGGGGRRPHRFLRPPAVTVRPPVAQRGQELV